MHLGIFLKDATESVVCSKSDKLFHSFGTKVWKAKSFLVFIRACGITRRPLFADKIEKIDDITKGLIL